MYEILLVNRSRKKDYNIETYVEKENLETEIRKGIASITRNMEDNISLLMKFSNLDYMNAEAVLIREISNKKNSILIIVGSEYVYNH